jgi:putative ABC transport system permease protein
VRSPAIAATADPNATSSGDSSGLTVYAADPGALAATDPTLATGDLFGDWHQKRAEHVAVLGAAAARTLGITRVDNQPAVFVNGVPYTVTGIVADFQREPEFLLGVIIPTSTALAAYGPPVDTRAQMLIETRLGAAALVAHQAPLLLRPDNPALFAVTAPPDPHTLRDSVTNDFNALFLLLAGICLVIGAVSIANTTLVAVLERTGEIGLRRSLGARAHHIAAQFLAESAALGALGGLVGTSLGVVTVVAVAAARQWTAILQPWAVFPAPLVGVAVGLAAGLYPALRAAWVEPVEALRR